MGSGVGFYKEGVFELFKGLAKSLKSDLGEIEKSLSLGVGVSTLIFILLIKKSP